MAHHKKTSRIANYSDSFGSDILTSEWNILLG